MAVEDIIFGKKRHMFGGIEPSNMITFEVVEPMVQSGAVKINVQIPNDTIIDGQMLCSVAGAVIVRRYDRYPENEFDGDVICTITDKAPATIQDLPMSADEPYKTCYYSAFPYSTQDVYNRNVLNRTMVNKPKSLALFSTRSKYNDETPCIRIYGSFDEDAVGTVSGVMIRRGTTWYPADETDGEYVTDIPYNADDINFMYDDCNNIEKDVTYYYSAFPYNSYGIYNRDRDNISECIARLNYWLYGYDLDTADSNPATRVTYPADVDNGTYRPVSHAGVNNSTQNTYEFSYGDWEDAEFMPKPCILKFDGTVYEYLNPDNYKETISGTASKVTDTSFEGNAMMEWGKIWTKRWEDENGIYHFRCSNHQVDSDYDCWCNYDKDNNQIDHFYTSIYMASFDDRSRARSISGATPAARNNAFAYSGFCRNTGSGWICETVSDRFLIQDLLVLIGKTTDTQAAFGGDGTKFTLTNGLLDGSGLFGVYCNAVKVFGMESWWGSDQLRFVQGMLYVRDSDQYEGYRIKITSGTHDGSSIAGFGSGGDLADHASNYTFIHTYPSTNLILNGIEGYIDSMLTLPYGRIPYVKCLDDYTMPVLAGSIGTYECDYYRIPKMNVGNCIYLYCGNNYGVGTNGDQFSTGAFHTYFNVSLTGTINANSFAIAYKTNSTTY